MTIDGDRSSGGLTSAGAGVQREHVDATLVVKEKHIDPTQWKPLIYNFRHYYGLGQALGKTFKAEV